MWNYNFLGICVLVFICGLIVNVGVVFLSDWLIRRDIRKRNRR